MMLTALGLLLVGYVPGAVLFRAPVLERDRRAALSADERLYWAVVLSVAWSSIAGFALAAAHRYSIGRLLAIDAAVAGLLLVIYRGRLRMPSAPRPTMAALAPAALVALCAFLFFPPAECTSSGARIPASTSTRASKSDSAARS